MPTPISIPPSRGSEQHLRRGYIDSAWGQLHYVEQGRGPALLLLHQTPRSWDEYRELIPILAPLFHVIAVDMLGFGASAREGPQQTIEGMADAAVAVINALSLAPCAILGHHTGAVVAIEVAASEPGLVSALILSSPPWADANNRAAHANRASVDNAMPLEDGSHLQVLWSQRRPYYPAQPAGLLNRFIRDALAPDLDPAEGHRACARYLMERRIGLVAAPVLLIGASDDPFAFPNLDPIRRHLIACRSIQTAIIEGGTVPLMEQKPNEVAAAVSTFLTSQRS